MLAESTCEEIMCYGGARGIEREGQKKGSYAVFGLVDGNKSREEQKAKEKLIIRGERLEEKDCAPLAGCGWVRRAGCHQP